MSEIEVSMIEEKVIKSELDKQLRALLSLCFPDEECFRTRRFVKLVPIVRFLALSDSELVGQIAVHDLEMTVDDRPVRYGGIAEIAVHPDYHKQGLAGELVSASHKWMREQEIEFALLFGKAEHYSSSGYQPLSQAIRYKNDSHGWTEEVHPHAMINYLGKSKLPAGACCLNGPLF